MVRLALLGPDLYDDDLEQFGTDHFHKDGTSMIGLCSLLPGSIGNICLQHQ